MVAAQVPGRIDLTWVVPLTLPAEDKSWKITDVEYDLDKIATGISRSVIGVTVRNLAHLETCIFIRSASSAR